MFKVSDIKSFSYEDLIKKLNRFGVIESIKNEEKKYVILTKKFDCDNKNKDYNGPQLPIMMDYKDYPTSYIQMILRRFNINSEDFFK